MSRGPFDQAVSTPATTGAVGRNGATANRLDPPRLARPSPPDVLLSARSVNVVFPKLHAVRDVSFDLKAGQLLGLIGPNGAGKTTLLRSLASLQPLSSGSVSIMGRPVSSTDREALTNVGFTPDTPSFYEQMTVRDYLRFIAKGYLLSDNEATERIGFWLEKVWLSEKAGQRIKSLSRGMRQRVGIARSLLPNPQVVMLDEPAGGLDPGGRVQFRQLMSDLRQQGKATIVSSHILSDLNEFCTHVGIMSAGVMLRFGTVTEVTAATNELAHAQSGGRTRYVARLARPVTSAAERFAGFDGVSSLQLEGDRASFEFSADALAASELLAELVRAGLPVASFAPVSVGLEEAYLRSGIAQVD